MAVTFDQLLDLIQMLVIVIGMILLYRSVPGAQLQRLLDTLDQLAKKTDTPVDDTVVSFGRLITQLLTGQLPGVGTPAPVPATVAVVATTPVPTATTEQAGRDFANGIADELKNRGLGAG